MTPPKYSTTLHHCGTEKTAADKAEAEVIMKSVLSKTDYWGQDLSTISGLTDLTAGYLSAMVSEGVPAVIKGLLED